MLYARNCTRLMYTTLYKHAAKLTVDIVCKVGMQLVIGFTILCMQLELLVTSDLVASNRLEKNDSFNIDD